MRDRERESQSQVGDRILRKEVSGVMFTEREKVETKPARVVQHLDGLQFIF